MEKIYMEESKKQRKSVMNASVALSFVVSIFAVFSLAMFGIVMNQGTGISYAAPNPDVDPNFTLQFGQSYDVVSLNDGSVFGFESYYYKDSHTIANQVFCIERNINVIDNANYSATFDRRPVGQSGLINTKDEPVTINHSPDLSEDYGLMYLLNVGQTESLRKEISDNDDLSTCVVQAAIWKYLASNYNEAEAFKLFKKTTETTVYDDFAVMESNNIKVNNVQQNNFNYKDKIDKLVNDAERAGMPKVVVTKADDEISKTEDGKYYQSSLITVSPSPTTISGYTVALSGVDGAIAVDEDGNEITGVVAPGKKFYVRIPAEKATEEVQKVQVNVTATFDAKRIVYYKIGDDSKQRMASLAPGDVNGGVEVEFVTTGDTGMNTAQTIYFIGLIVLLCGVGIVYANVKPVEAKQ